MLRRRRERRMLLNCWKDRIILKCSSGRLYTYLANFRFGHDFNSSGNPLKLVRSLEVFDG